MNKFRNLFNILDEATKPKTPVKDGEEEEDLFAGDPSKDKDTKEPEEVDAPEGNTDDEDKPEEKDGEFEDAFKDDPAKSDDPENPEGDSPEPTDDDGVTPELEDPGAEMDSEDDPTDPDDGTDPAEDDTAGDDEEVTEEEMNDAISFLSLTPVNSASLNIQLYNRYKSHLNDVNGMFIRIDTLIFETPEIKADFKKLLSEQYDILEIYMKIHFIGNIYDKNYANLITFIAKFTELLDLIDSAQQQSNK